MDSTIREPETVLSNRASEPLFVFLAYIFAQFSILSAGEHFPVKNPLEVVALLSTLGAASAAVAAGLWIDRSNGHRFVGRIIPRAPQVASCVGAAILAALAVCALASRFPHPGPADPMLAEAFLDKGPAMLVSWVFMTLVVAPIGEEMVFRGAIQGHLSGRIGNAASIVVSALLFLLMHIPQLDGYWVAIIAIFGLGLVAGIARTKYGSLLAAVVTHSAYNAVMIAFALVEAF